MNLFRVLCTVQALGLALLLVGAGSANAAEPRSPFQGTWDSIDAFGSEQMLVFKDTANDAVALILFVSPAACGVDENGQPLYEARAKGKGTATPTTLTAQLRIKCLSRPRTFAGMLAVSFTYDEGTDTLTDGFGIVWRRVP